MAKKELLEYVSDELQKTGDKICKQLCKYHDQYMKDQEKELETGENETYNKHCRKCPIIGWYH